MQLIDGVCQKHRLLVFLAGLLFVKEYGRDPGPCVHCKESYSKSSRYVHLVQKKNDPKHTVFYEYVKNHFNRYEYPIKCLFKKKKLHLSFTDLTKLQQFIAKQK
jgi:hypothetical protein